MDSNITEFDSIIFDLIRKRLFPNAIKLLNQKINNCRQISGDNYDMSGVSTRIHNYLLRSYCYFQLGSNDGLNMALDDVFSAVKLDNNRYQPYLLGALILSSMRQWNRSLEMLEKSIEINHNLFETFAHKMFYLKFKIMADNGFDEELSFSCALSHRYLDECLRNIKCRSVDTDSSIVELITEHKKEWIDIDFSSKNNFNYSDNYKTSKNMFNKSIDDHWSGSIDDFFSCGDQRLNQRVVQNNLKTEILGTISPKCEAIPDEYRSLESQMKDISLNEESHKSDSIQKWIETNFKSDSVSKMCSFDDNPKPAPTKQMSTALTDDQKSSIALSEIQSTFFEGQSSIVSQNRQLATNLMKLRGVYVGNLQKKCNEKVLKDLFRKYGTIVDFYQPFHSNYAFIHFKTHDSALQMLSDWKGSRNTDICKENKKLMVRFTPTQEQMQKYNSMSLSEYEKRCKSAKECHLWRSGKRCRYGTDCHFKHVPINRAVDTLPDKRKAKWKCN